MKKIEVTDLVQVNKAVLTPEAIKQLEALQADDNYGLDGVREDLSNAVCFIGRILDQIDERFYEQAHRTINNLSVTRDYISSLKKP